MTRDLINWQYCRDPNDINKAIINLDSNWEGLIDASQIISITYDTNHGCYVVFWTVNDTEERELVVERLRQARNKKSSTAKTQEPTTQQVSEDN